MTINQKQRNLESLISCQPDFAVLADMEHLENAIVATTREEELVQNSNQASDDVGEQQDTIQAEKIPHETTTSSHTLPLQPVEFVVGAFEDGPYPGEVQKVDSDFVNINFLVPVKNKDGSKTLWKWPTIADNHSLSRNSILPIHPCLEVRPASISRLILFEAVNCDLVDKFTG